MNASRQSRFDDAANTLGYSFAGEMKIGGHYASTVRNANEIYVSGQIPRVGDTLLFPGRVGLDVSLTDARTAASICAMRALALLGQSLGSLDCVERVLRICVYIQSAENFSQQSEVADAASDLLFHVLGQAGMHTRTSVGVYQLPKNAAVELDLIASVKNAA